jgi:hypothetical protein
MAITLRQKPAFVEGDGDVKTLNYVLYGTTSENNARLAFMSATATVLLSSIGTLYREQPHIRQTAYDQFDITVQYTRYKGLEGGQVGEYTWDFDTTGGTIHVTHSKESITRYGVGVAPELGSAAATNIPKHNQAIGVNSNSEAEGTEVIIPAMKLNVHFRHPLGFLTIAQAKFLHNLTGKVNSTPFFGFPAGEVLFLGARGGDGSAAEVSISYSFAMSANATGLTIGGITSVAKKGWEYLWIKYTPAVSANDKATQPQYAYVERLYDTADLAGQLGFG